MQRKKKEKDNTKKQTAQIISQKYREKKQSNSAPYSSYKFELSDNFLAAVLSRSGSGSLAYRGFEAEFVGPPSQVLKGGIEFSVCCCS